MEGDWDDLLRGFVVSCLWRSRRLHVVTMAERLSSLGNIIVLRCLVVDLVSDLMKLKLEQEWTPRQSSG
jgi:hypothetical protein